MPRQSSTSAAAKLLPSSLPFCPLPRRRTIRQNAAEAERSGAAASWWTSGEDAACGAIGRRLESRSKILFFAFRFFFLPQIFFDKQTEKKKTEELHRASSALCLLASTARVSPREHTDYNSFSVTGRRGAPEEYLNLKNDFDYRSGQLHQTLFFPFLAVVGSFHSTSSFDRLRRFLICVRGDQRAGQGARREKLNDLCPPPVKIS